VEPDAVIDLDGFNEVALAQGNVAAGLHVSFPSVSHWAALVNDQPRLGRDEIRNLAQLLQSYETVRDLVRFADRFGLPRSAMLATWCSWRLDAQTWVQSEAYARFLEGRVDGLRPEVCGPAFARQSAEAPFTAMADLWRHSSETLHDLCRGAGIPYLHVLQPTLLDDGAKPLTGAESGI